MHLPNLAHLHDLQFPVVHPQHLAGGGAGEDLVPLVSIRVAYIDEKSGARLSSAVVE